MEIYKFNDINEKIEERSTLIKNYAKLVKKTNKKFTKEFSDSAYNNSKLLKIIVIIISIVFFVCWIIMGALKSKVANDNIFIIVMIIMGTLFLFFLISLFMKADLNDKYNKDLYPAKILMKRANELGKEIEENIIESICFTEESKELLEYKALHNETEYNIYVQERLEIYKDKFKELLEDKKELEDKIELYMDWYYKLTGEEEQTIEIDHELRYRHAKSISPADETKIWIKPEEEDK